MLSLAVTKSYYQLRVSRTDLSLRTSVNHPHTATLNIFGCKPSKKVKNFYFLLEIFQTLSRIMADLLRKSWESYIRVFEVVEVKVCWLMLAWFVIDAAVTSKCQNIAQSELVADLCNADVPMVPDTGARVQHMRRHHTFSPSSKTMHKTIQNLNCKLSPCPSLVI